MMRYHRVFLAAASAALILGSFANVALAGDRHGKQCPMSESGKSCCKKMGKQCPMDGEKKSCCKKGMHEGKQCPMANVLSAKEIAKSPSVKAYNNAFKSMHEGMNIAYTGNVDTDFTRGMIPHHQGAVDMAKVVLQYGKDQEVKNLAEWIVSIQKQEIAQMEHWLTRKGVAKGEKASDYDAEAVTAYEAAMHQMHKDMDIVYSGNADVDFVMGMIPHHQGAIEMAKIQLKSGMDAEIAKLAEGVIRTQNGEIAVMQRWLKKQGIDCAKTYQDQVAAKRNGTSKHKMKHHH